MTVGSLSNAVAVAKVAGLFDEMAATYRVVANKHAVGIALMDTSQQSSVSESAISAFRQVCVEFDALSRGERDGDIPLWVGGWTGFKYGMRHPIRTYSGIFKAIRAQTSLGIFLPNFPLEAMLEFLKQFTDTELKGLKALSETQLRRMKSQITGNPLLKLSVPVGSAYALLEVSDKLVTIRGSQLDFLKTIIRSDAVQTLMGSLLTGFIIGLLGLAVMYFLVILPSIARAQLLDDLLQIALDGRTFEAKAQPQANSNQRKE